MSLIGFTRERFRVWVREMASTSTLCAAMLLVVLSALCACSQQQVLRGKALTISQQDGHPVYIFGSRQIHFDWSGHMLAVSRASAKNLFWTAMRPACTSVPQPWARQFVGEGAAASHQAWVYPLNSPVGWPPLGVVTVTKDWPERESSPETREVQAYCVDLRDGSLLAEFDLDEMFSSLYGVPKTDFVGASVNQASIGPDGAVGLALSFTYSSSYFWEVGLWNDGRWIPLAAPKGNPRPDTLIVGPGNRAIVEFSNSSSVGISIVQFYDAAGNLTSSFNTSPRQLDTLVDKWRTSIVAVLLLISATAFGAVAMLGLFWQVLPNR